MEAKKFFEEQMTRIGQEHGAKVLERFAQDAGAMYCVQTICVCTIAFEKQDKQGWDADRAKTIRYIENIVLNAEQDA
jgi:hypothetical protein